jgi:hypothetical protein
MVAAGTAREDGTVAAVALDGSVVRVAPVQSAAFVPRLGRSGAVVDLALAAAATPAGTTVEGQVWLGRDDADAERALRQRLATAGVQTGPRTSAAGAAAVLARSGAVLALLLFVACGAVAVVVAAGAMIVAALVGARQRGAESAALRLVGVPSGTVLRGLLVENLAGVAVACVAGALGAAVASWAVLPVLPLFDEPSSMLDVRTAPDLAAGLVSLLAVAAGLGALAAVVTVVQARRGTAGRLGESSR